MESCAGSSIGVALIMQLYGVVCSVSTSSACLSRFHSLNCNAEVSRGHGQVSCSDLMLTPGLAPYSPIVAKGDVLVGDCCTVFRLGAAWPSHGLADPLNAIEPGTARADVYPRSTPPKSECAQSCCCMNLQTNWRNSILHRPAHTLQRSFSTHVHTVYRSR
jgi:hypothetical protein